MNTASADLDQLLTVVLILKDRPEYTLRWLSYANRTTFPFSVLIADGGAGDEISAMFASSEPFPNLKLEYLRYPVDETLHVFYAKLADAVGRVRTPYVMKASNDDFYSVDGIRNSLAFLESHPEFSGARGGIADFALDPRGIPEVDKFVYGQIDHCERFKAGEGSNVHPRAIDRVASQAAFYVTCWHDVSRTATQSEHQRILLRANPTDARIADHVTDFLAVAAGPVHRGAFPYMFRQSNPRSGGGRGLIDQFQSQAEWVATPSWEHDTENLYSVVGKEIAKRDAISEEMAKESVRKNYVANYLAELLLRDMPETPSIGFTFKRAFRRIADVLPLVGPIRRILASLAARRRIRRAGKTIVTLGWKQESAPIVEFLSSGISR